jgi:hypothetical protein
LQITVNSTPFPAEPFVSTDKLGQKRCTVVLKASFEVAEDGQCRPADQQRALVYADEHYGDPGTTSIAHECDFAPQKPLIDVLVHGSAIAPHRRAVSELEVALAGPGLDKRALVTGDRTWVRRLAGIGASSPRPFEAMPLVWDRAFGGSDLSSDKPTRHASELRNLVGVGFHVNDDVATIEGASLPNIETPRATMRSWSDRPEPIGFGPVGRGWSPRLRLAGTYDRRWFDEVRPFLPADFDDRYFQAAPIDQQFAELPPGAVFECKNMCERGRFVARLPVLWVPVLFRFADRNVLTTLVRDTVILEPDRRRLIMVGRASAPLGRKLTALREIHIGRTLQHPDRPVYPDLGTAVRSQRKLRAQP